MRSQQKRQMPSGGFTARNAAGVLCFMLLFGALFALFERALYNDTSFCSTWNRIREDGDVPQVLILGNSHAFCSFVPDLINGALGVDSAVLGASGQNAQGMADALEAVLRVGAPELVVVEMRALFFDPDEALTSHKRAALSHINGMPGYAQRAVSTLRQFAYDDVPQGMFQLLRSDMMWQRWERHEPPVNRYEGEDVLGYTFMNWHARGEYDAAKRQREALAMSATQETEPIDPRNEAAFRHLLALARQHHVPIWLVKTPLSYTDSATFATENTLAAIAADYGDTVRVTHDFTVNVADMGLTNTSFYDNGHLSREGAAAFTVFFTEWMGERLGITPEWENAFGYRGESVSQQAEEQWRYTMYALGRDVRYRFSLETDGEVTLLRDWSDSGSLALALPPSEASRLRVTMCPAAWLNQAERLSLTLPFMTENTYRMSEK